MHHRTPRQDGQIVIVADSSDNPARPGVTFDKADVPCPILGTFVGVFSPG